MFDDGKGFSDKDLLKADKPYYSGEAQKQEYHFGLDLHICRTLCEKHGGRLQLENAPQSGAKITARFPCNKTAAIWHKRHVAAVFDIWHETLHQL